MALHRILEDTADGVEDGWAGADDQDGDLPGHPGDYDWDGVAEDVFRDIDLLTLVDSNLDGIEDPDSELAGGWA